MKGSELGLWDLMVSAKGYMTLGQLSSSLVSQSPHLENLDDNASVNEDSLLLCEMLRTEMGHCKSSIFVVFIIISLYTFFLSFYVTHAHVHTLNTYQVGFLEEEFC